MLQGNLMYKMLEVCIAYLVEQIIMYKFYSMHALGFKHEVIHVYQKSLHLWCQVSVRRCQGLKIFCCLKKKKPVCRHLKYAYFRALSLPTTHRCFMGLFCVCVCAVCVIQQLNLHAKNKCPEFSYWYSLLVNVYHACNLFRNVEDSTKCIGMF